MWFGGWAGAFGEGPLPDLFMLLLCLSQRTAHPDETAAEDECHGRHRHHTVVHIEAAVFGINTFGNDTQAEEGAAAEEFTEETYGHEYPGIAQNADDTVEE